MQDRVDKRDRRKYLKDMSFRLSLMGVGFCVTAICVGALTPEKTSDLISDPKLSPATLLENAYRPHVQPSKSAMRSYHDVMKEVGQDLGQTGTESWGDNNISDMTGTTQEFSIRHYPAIEDSINDSLDRDSLDYDAPKMAALTPQSIRPEILPAPKLKTPPTRITHAVDIKKVQSRIKRVMREKHMVGLSIAIVENGQLTYADGFGETLKGSGDKVTKDTIFRWASVSKGVAAATLMSLADEGKLALDAPVSGFQTSLKLPKSRHDITVEDLLSHRVGIVRNAYDRRIEEGRSPQNVRDSIQHLRHVCAPGTCHSYQNVIYDSASEIAEDLTGIPYKSVVSERLFRPLDMTSASLTYEGLIRAKSWAKPHTRVGRPIRRVKPNYYRVPAAAGVNSSIIDLSKWMTAQMDDHSPVISKFAQAEMQTARVNTPREARLLRRKYYAMNNAKYGLGWRIYNYGGHKVVGHRGGVEGYRALVLFDPDIKTGVAMMWNSSHSDPIGLQLEIMDQVYGNRPRDWMRLNRR